MISIIISGISLIVSSLTLYFMFLRPPKLKIFIGPYIIVYRDIFYFSFIVPTAIANHSNQTGVIKRATMIITHKDVPQQNYNMLWSNFRKLNVEGNTWIQGDIVNLIAVIAKSTKSKNIEYQWNFESTPKLFLKAGTYKIHFYFWSDKQTPIAKLEHEIYINEDQERHLNDPGKTGKTILLTIDNEQNKNEVLTLSQVKKI